MDEFFDIEKLENYKGWLKKINNYFKGERVSLNKLWKFLTETMSLNEGKWYDLKLSLIFLYGSFISSGNDDESIDMIEYDDVERLLIDMDGNYEDDEIALSEFLDVPPFLLEENKYGHYGGGVVFNVIIDDSEYAVYNEDNIDDAYDEWKDSYMEDMDLNDLYNIESYLDFDMNSSIIQNFISEEVDYVLENKTDDEILEIADMVNEKEDLERQINTIKKYKENNKTEKYNLINDIKLIDSQIYGLEIKNDEGEYDEKIENLELEKEEIEKLIIEIDYDNEQVEDDLMGVMGELDDLIEYKVKEVAEDIIFDDISNEIESDPFDYFYNRLGYDYSDIVAYGYATFAVNDYKNNMFDDSERGINMSPYDGIEEEIEHNGKTYYIHRIN